MLFNSNKCWQIFGRPSVHQLCQVHDLRQGPLRRPGLALPEVEPDGRNVAEWTRKNELKL